MDVAFQLRKHSRGGGHMVSSCRCLVHVLMYETILPTVKSLVQFLDARFHSKRRFLRYPSTQTVMHSQ